MLNVTKSKFWNLKNLIFARKFWWPIGSTSHSICTFEKRKIHTRSMKHHGMTKKWLAYTPKPSLDHFSSEKMKQPMEIDIGRCWLIMSAQKCMEKVSTVIGFKKMVHHATLQTKQCSFCNKNSLDVWWQKMPTLTAQQDLQIWTHWTSFYGVVLGCCI